MSVETMALRPVDSPAGVGPGAVYATHEGEFAAGPVVVKVYQLNTGQRVIDAESMERLAAWLFGDPEGE